MKFAIKEDPNGHGFYLCNAETGEALPGQESFVLTSLPRGSSARVVLVLRNLPVYRSDEQGG